MAINMTFVDYVTPIPADWLNNVNTVVNAGGGGGGSTANGVVQNITALRAVLSSKISYVFVASYATLGDEGGGFYYFDPNDTTSPDNGGTIIVATDNARWKLISNTGVISVTQFGADVTGNADSAPAFRAAIAAAPYGGTIFVPAGLYLLNSAVNNAILDFTSFPNKGLTIQGVGWSLKNNGSFSFGVNYASGPRGSILIVGSSITTGVDFFHQAPTDLVIGGVAWKDFAVVASTGAYGVPHGQNGFNIDGSAGGYIENLLMENVFIDNMANGSSILVNGVTNVQGVLAGAVFRRSKFMNFAAPGFGDSNTIEHNVIGANAGASGAVGISFYNVSGATNTRILNNDMVNFNGMILCQGSTKMIIDGNEFEQSTGSSNSLGALVSLNGSNGTIDTPTITNNSFAQNSTVANYIPLYVANTNGGDISSNRFSTLASYSAVQFVSNSSYVEMSNGNQHWINGVVQDGVLVINAGVKQMLRNSAWTSYTPTVTASSGTFGSVSAAGAWQLLDTRTLMIRATVIITSVGTAASTVFVTLPSGLAAASLQTLSGREIANTGDGLAISITASSGTMSVTAASGASIIGVGNELVITGFIEII